VGNDRAETQAETSRDWLRQVDAWHVEYALLDTRSDRALIEGLLSRSEWKVAGRGDGLVLLECVH
jgi:hypothetical protein